MNGLAVLPETLAVIVAGSEFEQTVTGGTVTFGFGLTVNVPELEPVQPFVSVTVTLYVPGTVTLIEAAFGNGPVPCGPVQL